LPAPSRPPPPPRHRRKYLTVPEWLALRRTAAGDPRALALVLLMYECGLRREEPGLMHLSYLERLHENELYVYRQKKSNSGWVFDVSSGLCRALSAWVDVAYPLREERTRDSFLFPGRRRVDGVSLKGITGRTVYNVYRDFATKANIGNSQRHPHVLKASRVQHLLEHMTDQGLDPWLAIKTLATIVGHTTAQTTIKHYVAETALEKVRVHDFTQKMTGD